MTDFLAQKCQARTSAMSEDAIRSHLAQMSGWREAGGAIEKRFAFKGWLETVAFVDALALVLLLLVSSVFGVFASPVFAGWSRRDEFEADAFASTHASGRELASALLKLHEDNASTLTPDPLYARFYYSHPPAVERLAALAALVVRPPEPIAP